jgi:RimJ/RimL family protein N-acetyltransferase
VHAERLARHASGLGIAREAWGKGYAAEGASAAIDWVFDNLRWREVVHCIDSLNANSRKVAIRLGSRKLRQAQMSAPFSDRVCDAWGQSRAEWVARQRRDV